LLARFRRSLHCKILGAAIGGSGRAAESRARQRLTRLGYRARGPLASLSVFPARAR
jgi:hypothetical protein